MHPLKPISNSWLWGSCVTTPPGNGGYESRRRQRDRDDCIQDSRRGPGPGGEGGFRVFVLRTRQIELSRHEDKLGRMILTWSASSGWSLAVAWPGGRSNAVPARADHQRPGH